MPDVVTRRFDRVASATLVLVLLAGCTTIRRCSYEGFGRDERQQPERVIEALGITPGTRIADLGSGSGYFTFRLADATGPTGKVYAVDVDEAMQEYLAGIVRERGVENVEIVIATPDDAGLPEGEIDLLFTSNTYHHIEDPVSYFTRARRHLGAEGRIAIIDYHEDAGWFQSTFGHAIDGDVIEEHMTEAGYELVAEPGFLEQQNFLIFAPAQ